MTHRWNQALVRYASLGLLALGLAAPSAALAQTGHHPLQATPESASPVASPAADWQVGSVTVVDVDGSPVALSPDGQWLAGFGPEREFCVWEVVTLDPTCASGDVIPISADSIVWSPDSSAVAFTEDIFVQLWESDIHVFERATGEIVNLTDDDLEGGVVNLSDLPSVPVDAMPAWESDSQSILFTRSDMGGDRNAVPTDLMRISRSGGEAEQVGTLYADGPYAVFTTMYSLSDGSLLYALNPVDQNSAARGIWMRSPEGTATKVMDAHPSSDFPSATLTSVREVNGTVLAAGISIVNASQMNIDRPIAFVLDVSSGEVTALEPDETTFDAPSYTVISPDGGTTLSVLIGPGQEDQVSLLGTEATVVDLGPGGVATGAGMGSRWGGPQWSESGTVFISRGMLADPYLLTMTPAT